MIRRPFGSSLHSLRLLFGDGVLFRHDKADILPFVTAQMDLEHIVLGEISQTEKDEWSMISYM